MVLLRSLPTVQHELGSSLWTIDRELLARIVERFDKLERISLVGLLGHKDPGPSVKILRPGDEPEEESARAPVRRPPQQRRMGQEDDGERHTATAADWQAQGIPVRVVSSEDGEE